MLMFFRLAFAITLGALAGCGSTEVGDAVNTMDASTFTGAPSSPSGGLAMVNVPSQPTPTDGLPEGGMIQPAPADASIQPDAEVDAQMMANPRDAGVTPPVDAEVDAEVALEADALPPRMCDVDTDVLGESARSSYGPASRVTALDVPINATAAEMAGCSVEGAKKGSGLQDLLDRFNVNLTDEFRADEQGRYDTIILMEVANWMVGQTGAQHAFGTINFYSAKQDEMDQVIIERDSFINDNPALSPLITFEGDTRCARIETTPGEFSLSLNVSEGNDALIRLKETRLQGNIAVADEGLTVTDAHLGGYFTRESVNQLLGDLQVICAAPNAPSFCIALLLFMNNPDGVVDTFMGGYDSYVGPNGEIDGACRPGQCNAVSVCLLMSAEPMKIDGLEGSN
ncbi:MAG: hypothetical protein VX589_15890 [Myxococcota bacterium]|nr:hypothetical protein [Myxococcota bacterium]